MITLRARNAPEAYVESYWTMKAYAKPEQSRAGPVMTIPQPVMLEVDQPWERVIFDPDRNANPFFHVMETVWMLAGDNRVGFPAKFNSTYVNYAEPDGVVHGAYGKRWRDHWRVRETNGRYSLDQIQLAIAILKKDPSSRQVVLGMWDPPEDLGATVRDRPCNTHIYFRAHEGTSDWALDMTVCNRSNDLLWGMLGANIVHMTYLHELVAFGAGMEMGKYRVFTNNLHIYTEADVSWKFLKGPIRHDPYGVVQAYPLLGEGEKVEDLLADCEDFMSPLKRPETTSYRTEWVNHVVAPMYLAYMARVKKTGNGLEYVERIKAEDWRLACRQWIERKTQSSVISTGQ